MKITKYPDGSSYVDIEGVSSPSITHRVNSYEDLWHLNQIVDAYNHEGIKPNITIPNLIDAQADRRFGIYQSSGLKLVADFLNNMNASFEIFHPHNPEVVEALIKDVRIINNAKFINNVLYKLMNDKYGYEYDNFQRDAFVANTILMSSDAGGFKPLIRLSDKINWRGETFSAAKSRSWDELDGTKFVQQIDREDFGGKDIIIVDDISVYGGTFKGLAKLLKGKNVGKIYLAVSHMTVQELGEDPVTNYYEKVFTTNSKFNKYFTSEGKFHSLEPNNLEIIKMFNI